MPKLKTKSAAAKRIKVTKSGKCKRAQANHRHILTKKSHKKKRQQTRTLMLHDADQKRVKVLLPYA